MPIPRDAGLVSGIDHAESVKKFYCRSVAQPGSALYWGCRGRGFKSRRSDHIVSKGAYISAFFIA